MTASVMVVRELTAGVTVVKELTVGVPALCAAELSAGDWCVAP